MTPHEEDKRWVELLHKQANVGLTPEERAEWRVLNLPKPRKKPERKAWGKPGSKVSRKLPSNVFSAGAKRDIVLSVYPDGVLGLRLARHGLKSEVKIDVSTVYRIAASRQMRVEKAKRKAERKAKRA